MRGTFRLSVVREPATVPAGDDRMGVRPPLRRPRAESDDALIAIACARTVDDAAAAALEDMLDWLGDLRPGLAREDAYMLCSVAADVRVSQLVNGESRGAHVVLEKRFLPPPDAAADDASRDMDAEVTALDDDSDDVSRDMDAAEDGDSEADDDD